MNLNRKNQPLWYKASPLLLLLVLGGLLGGCGMLAPKYFPANQTILSTIQISHDDLIDQELEQRIATLFLGEDLTPEERARLEQMEASGDAIAGGGRMIFPRPGRVLFINALPGVDSNHVKPLSEALMENPMVLDVQVTSVGQIPSLANLRLMAARQRSRYIVLLNAYNNEYRYANLWTVPAFLTLGIGFFGMPSESIWVFSKVEYSVLDVIENLVIQNDSSTGEAYTRATLPESGVEGHRMRISAMEAALERLGQQFEEKF